MPIHDPRNVNEHLSLAKKRDLRTYRNTLSPVVEYRERKREREREAAAPPIASTYRFVDSSGGNTSRTLKACWW